MKKVFILKNEGKVSLPIEKMVNEISILDKILNATDVNFTLALTHPSLFNEIVKYEPEKDKKLYYKGDDPYQLSYLHHMYNRVLTKEEIELIDKEFLKESKIILSKDAVSKSKLNKLKNIIYSSFNIEAICRFNNLFYLNLTELRGKCEYLTEIRRINRLCKKSHLWLEDALIKAVQENKDRVLIFKSNRYTIDVTNRLDYFTVCLDTVNYFNFIIENGKVKILSLEESKERAGITIKKILNNWKKMRDNDEYWINTIGLLKGMSSYEIKKVKALADEVISEELIKLIKTKIFHRQRTVKSFVDDLLNSKNYSDLRSYLPDSVISDLNNKLSESVTYADIVKHIMLRMSEITL